MPITALAPQASASANSATFAKRRARVLAGLRLVKGGLINGLTLAPSAAPSASIRDEAVNSARAPEGRRVRTLGGVRRVPRRVHRGHAHSRSKAVGMSDERSA